MMRINKKNKGWLTVGKRDPFYDYYQRELSYLRQAGGIFARNFPKIAQRLDLSLLESADPHVERLIESFAYLTARLQRDIDDQFPQFSQALLRVLYPQFIQPLPPYTIARFFPSDDKGKLTSCYHVPKKTPLFARAQQDQVCRFWTSYDLDLLPITLTCAELIPTSSGAFSTATISTQQVLKFCFESKAGTFKDLSLSKIRLYIPGNPVLRRDLYEGIMTPDGAAWYVNQQGQIDCLNRKAIKPVGFGEDEGIFPYSNQAHAGYRLLLEYFYCQDKFFFIDIESSKLNVDSKTIEILVPFADQVNVRSQDITAQNFLLGCVPVVNLFEKTSEPLILDRRTVEYRLVGDLRHETTTEIYDVQEVMATVKGKKDVITFRPYFSYRHDAVERQDKTFWHMRRVDTNRLDLPGTDVHLSFVDFNFDPLAPPSDTIYAKVLCTNRQLAQHIPSGGLLYGEEKLPVDEIVCLERPTAPVYPPMDGSIQWRLISQLSLNHLGLTGGEKALGSMRELMRLYASLDRERVIPELDMLVGLETTTVVRRFGMEAWRGFAEGTQIKITFDPKESLDASGFMFATLLNHVLPMFTSMTAFTEVEIHKTTQEGIWKRWQPRSGTRVLL